jgi:hypothetical protein
VDINISEARVPRTTVALTFDYVTAQVATQKGNRVERPSEGTLIIHNRYTPGWAVILGIVGLLFFLLGLLFFLVKSIETATVLGRDEAGGAVFTATGRSSWQVNWILHRAFDLPTTDMVPKRVSREPRPEVSGDEAMLVAAASATSMTEQLRQLADLHSDGVLTEEEFQAAKARILAEGS